MLISGCFVGLLRSRAAAVKPTLSVLCVNILFFRHLRVFSRQHSSAEDLVETAGCVSLVAGLVGAYIRHREPPLPAMVLRKRTRRETDSYKNNFDGRIPASTKNLCFKDGICLALCRWNVNMRSQNGKSTAFCVI